MNAQPLAGLRPQPFAAATYRAFRVTPMTKNDFTGAVGNATIPLNVDGAESLRDAVNAAQRGCFHKDCLVIHEADERGQRVHIFAIKQKSSANYERDRRGILRRVQTLYPKLVCVIDSQAFALQPHKPAGMAG